VDIEDVTRALALGTTIVWFGGSLYGLLLAARLHGRAVRDLWRLRASGADGALTYAAWANLWRVRMHLGVVALKGIVAGVALLGYAWPALRGSAIGVVQLALLALLAVLVDAHIWQDGRFDARLRRYAAERARTERVERVEREAAAE
jgi:hypothetical protein